MSQDLSSEEFQSVLRRVLVLSSMVDGEIDPAEVEVIQKVYRHLLHEELTESDLMDEVTDLVGHSLSVGRYVQSYADRLSWDRKQSLLKGALLVTGADQLVRLEEDALVQGVASALASDAAELERLVRAVQQPKKVP